MSRDQLINIFNNTIDIVAKDGFYRTSNGDVYEFTPVGETFTYKEKPIIGPIKSKYDSTEVSVINDDCLCVANHFAKLGLKCAVLNMASFIRPGGGVRKGSSAQEESLFRRTNLLMSLYQFDGELYNLTGKDEPILDVYPLPLNFGAIYSKDITVFRTSERTDTCRLMDDPFTIDVITIAAIKHPPIEESGKLSKWVTEVLKKKVGMMLDLCIIHGVDVPILGAFGCGAYGTPPEQMANIFKEVLMMDKYKGVFKSIIFPIIDDNNSHKEHNPNGNFKPFFEILPKEL